jgi:hypothetical protein
MTMGPIAALLLLSLSAPAIKDADDPTLRALVDELARYQSLKAGSLERPYHLEAAVVDLESVDLQASFGALVRDGHGKHSLATVDVRVGTAQLDNSNFRGGAFTFGDVHGLGGGVPRDADYDALRQALWLRLDDSYKQAVETLAHKKAYLEATLVPDRPADFGPASLENVLLPRVSLKVDRPRWTRIVKATSAVFRDQPLVSTATASFEATSTNQALVTTDPVRTRFGEIHRTFFLTATAQAPDGMPLQVEYEASGRTDADLPKEAQLVHAAHELGKQLEALAHAPVLPEDYSGPVLFTGRAAALFFLKAIAEPLGNPREPLGQPVEGRLIERLGKHIASKIVTVRDDPTQKSWHGTPLMGWFPVDDDGVVPKPITLVKNGVLETYYMSRVPTQKVPATNGHSRAGRGSAGNVFAESPAPSSRAALKRQLIELAKENDQEYGLLVEDFAGRPANQGGGFEMFFGGASRGSDIALPPPSVAYRVFLDGREELVRGASFKAISFRALRDIVAMGDDPTVLNAISGGQPVSSVAPSVLVKELELKKPNHDFEKPPAIPRPSVAAKP